MRWKHEDTHQFLQDLCELWSVSYCKNKLLRISHFPPSSIGVYAMCWSTRPATPKATMYTEPPGYSCADSKSAYAYSFILLGIHAHRFMKCRCMYIYTHLYISLAVRGRPSWHAGRYLNLHVDLPQVLQSDSFDNHISPLRENMELKVYKYSLPFA